jgi:hypothetical protein
MNRNVRLIADLPPLEKSFGRLYWVDDDEINGLTGADAHVTGYCQAADHGRN